MAAELLCDLNHCPLMLFLSAPLTCPAQHQSPYWELRLKRPSWCPYPISTSSSKWSARKYIQLYKFYLWAMRKVQVKDYDHASQPEKDKYDRSASWTGQMNPLELLKVSSNSSFCGVPYACLLAKSYPWYLRNTSQGRPLLSTLALAWLVSLISSCVSSASSPLLLHSLCCWETY